MSKRLHPPRLLPVFLLALLLCGSAQAAGSFTLARTVSPGCFSAGQQVQVQVTLALTPSAPVTALGLEDTLPSGWSYAGTAPSADAPAITPFAGETGLLEFAWSTLPSAYPVTFTYTITAPASPSSSYTLSGRALVRELNLGETPTGTVATPLLKCGTGCLQVALLPNDGSIAGATWSVDGGPAQASGATVCDLSQGAHTVTVSKVPGKTAPAAHPVTITASTTAAVSLAYTAGPVITRLGSSPVIVEAFTPYTDAGATAVNGAGASITSRIVTVNPVNTSLTGSYTVTYNATDLADNPAVEVNRLVQVVDTIKPNAPLVTGATPTNNRRPAWSWTTGGNRGSGIFRFTPPGGTLSGETTATSYTPPANLSAGSYTLTVEERDTALNWSDPRSHTIVIDLTPPGISITGPFIPPATSGPPAASVGTGATLHYLVTYTGADSILLSPAYLTQPRNLTARGNAAVSGTGNTRTIALTNLRGEDGLNLSVAAGTAADLAGNFAAAVNGTAFTVQELRTKSYVDFAYTGPENGQPETPYNTLQEAVDNAGASSVIRFQPGHTAEHFTITKALELNCLNGTVRLGASSKGLLPAPHSQAAADSAAAEVPAASRRTTAPAPYPADHGHAGQQALRAPPSTAPAISPANTATATGATDASATDTPATVSADTPAAESPAAPPDLNTAGGCVRVLTKPWTWHDHTGDLLTLLAGITLLAWASQRRPGA